MNRLHQYRLMALLVVGAGLAASPGCRPRGSTATDVTAAYEAPPDQPGDSSDLARDLQATLLENFLQLSLGNMESYADSIARDHDVVLAGVRPTDLATGREAQQVRDRRLFRGLEPIIHSKNLHVYLSENGHVGWADDELSYRVKVPGLAKSAVMSVRFTAVLVRDIDRWAIVMEHWSYALPVDEILIRVRAAGAVPPAKMKTRYAHPALALLLLESVDRLHAKGFRFGPRDPRDPSLDPDVLILWPDPNHEYRGGLPSDAPTLALLFGKSASVSVDNYQTFTALGAPSVAWMVANLTVRAVVNDDPVMVSLRATYVLERRAHGWEVRQAHIAAPVTEDDLSKRVFGKAL